MGNPFEDDGGLFFVLVNRAQGFTVWPTTVGRPQDWRVAFGPGTRGQCAAYVKTHDPDEAHHPGRMPSARRAVHRT